MTTSAHIDLVLPVFQPGDSWAQETCDHMQSLETALGSGVHLIVVDDGSADSRPFDSLLRLRPDTTLVTLATNKGKGFALREGMRHSHAPFTLFTDADFPYTVESMHALLRALSDHDADIALGYREQDYYAKVPWFRKGLSEFFRFVLRRLLRFPITDTQCGLKGMNEKGRRIFLQTSIDRFLVDMEFIKHAVREPGVNVKPVVVELRNDVTFSKMGVGVLLREGLNFLKILLG